jgi:hypothetical protein
VPCIRRLKRQPGAWRYSTALSDNLKIPNRQHGCKIPRTAYLQAHTTAVSPCKTHHRGIFREKTQKDIAKQCCQETKKRIPQQATKANTLHGSQATLDSTRDRSNEFKYTKEKKEKNAEEEVRLERAGVRAWLTSARSRGHFSWGLEQGRHAAAIIGRPPELHLHTR